MHQALRCSFVFVLLFLSVSTFAIPGERHVVADTLPPGNNLHTRWNDAHNRPDSAALLQLFDKYVLYYGVRLPREKVVAQKMKFFRANPGYSQVMDQVNFLVNTGQQKDVRFMKTVSANGHIATVPARLQLVQRNNRWVIAGESDSISDARFEAAENIPADAETGDFNGDGKKDRVWLVRPIVKDGEMDCEGDCNARLLLSVPGSAPYIIKNCIGNDPMNLGDLDGNGTDEIGMLHDWFTSCWKAYYVLTFRNNKWQPIIPPVSTHCTQWEDEGEMPVKKHPKKKGYVLVRYSVMTEEGIEVKTKTVKLK
ncbi:MAG: hypothetical protein JNM68_02665 [Dinghuibacter sp.]|nr:hypothetical protein [Dinghuibacter sp.]